MAIMYDWVCSQGHVYEALAPMGVTEMDCAYCDYGEHMGKSPDLSIYTTAALEIAKRKAEELYDSEQDIDNNGNFVFPSYKAHRVLLATPAWNRRNANSLKIVVHRDPITGQYNFPAHPNAPVPYGYEKVDVTDMHHARAIERQVEAQEAAKEADYIAAQRESKERYRKSLEDDLRAKMGDMSAKGKEFAEYAIKQEREKIQEKSTRVKSVNAGFEALAYDRSNRQEYRDKETDWKKRQE